MFASYQKDTRTAQERLLQDELDSVREQQARDYEREQRARKEREAERREEREANFRRADDWPDALGKQIILCQREIADGEEDDDDFIGSSINSFFKNTSDACEMAKKFWSEVEVSKQAAIEELENEIAAIQGSIRLEVAIRLEAADQRHEFTQVAAQIRNDELSDFLNW